jgi:hypothetical protein
MTECKFDMLDLNGDAVPFNNDGRRLIGYSKKFTNAVKRVEHIVDNIFHDYSTPTIDVPITLYKEKYRRGYLDVFFRHEGIAIQINTDEVFLSDGKRKARKISETRVWCDINGITLVEIDCTRPERWYTYLKKAFNPPHLASMGDV